MFRDALVTPTENVVAQALWAERRSLDLGLAASAKQQEVHSNEGAAWSEFGAGRYSETLDSCEAWLDEEPFSRRPADLGSFVALGMTGDYHKALMFTNIGLQATPGDSLLLNNRAVAYANLGQLENAEIDIRHARAAADSARLLLTVTATQGLLAYREMDSARGRALYEEARRMAQEVGEERLITLVQVHHAKECQVAVRRSADASAEEVGYAEEMRRFLGEMVECKDLTTRGIARHFIDEASRA